MRWQHKSFPSCFITSLVVIISILTLSFTQLWFTSLSSFVFLDQGTLCIIIRDITEMSPPPITVKLGLGVQWIMRWNPSQSKITFRCLKMSCLSAVHRHISLFLLWVEVFAIAGEPCYQILKMLSSLPRLPTRAGDMSSSPLYHHLLSSPLFDAFQMSESSSNLPFFVPH